MADAVVDEVHAPHLEDSTFDQATFMAEIRMKLGTPESRTVDLTNFPEVISGSDPDAEFVEKIKEVGVIVPVVGFEDPRVEGQLIPVDGKRRIKAARLAGLTHIKAEVYTKEAYLGWSTMLIMLNEQRSPNPIAEFDAIKDLQMNHRMTLREVAACTGMSIGTVKRRLRLGGLDPDLFEHARMGHITPGVLEAAAKLPLDEQQVLTAKAIAGGRLTHDDVSRVREVQRKETIATLPDEIFQQPAEDHLEKALHYFNLFGKELDKLKDRVLVHQLASYTSTFLDLMHDTVAKHAKFVDEVCMAEEALALREGRDPRRGDEILTLVEQAWFSDGRRKQEDGLRDSQTWRSGKSVEVVEDDHPAPGEGDVAGEVPADDREQPSVDKKPRRVVKTFGEGEAVRIGYGSHKGCVGNVYTVKADGRYDVAFASRDGRDLILEFGQGSLVKI